VPSWADAGPPDAGPPDAGVDAGSTDSGAPDAETPDSGVDSGVDAGEADSGPADAGADAGLTATCTGSLDGGFVLVLNGAAPDAGGQGYLDIVTFCPNPAIASLDGGVDVSVVVSNFQSMSGAYVKFKYKWGPPFLRATNVDFHRSLLGDPPVLPTVCLDGLSGPGNTGNCNVADVGYVEVSGIANNNTDAHASGVLFNVHFELYQLGKADLAITDNLEGDPVGTPLPATTIDGKVQ